MSINAGDSLETFGIPSELQASVAQKMESYINEIALFNSAYNLTNTSDHDELVIRHIYDSLSPYKIIGELLSKMEAPVMADIGSGGGLPGIPLAASFPQYKVKLVERMSKRCAFLENCAAILGLSNVEVICSEAEKVKPESFDLITFRAFRPLDEAMTKTLLNIVKPGGYLCAYKAKSENIKEEMNGITKLVPDYKVYALTVPGLEDTERNLVVIRKD